MISEVRKLNDLTTGRPITTATMSSIESRNKYSGEKALLRLTHP